MSIISDASKKVKEIKQKLGSPTGIIDPLSYNTIKNTIYEWRRSGTESSEFNRLDIPGHLYFKILFHFWNGDNMNGNIAMENGLLAPTWGWSSKSMDVTNNVNNTESNIVKGDLDAQREAIDNVVSAFKKDQEKDVFDPDSGIKNLDLNPMHNSAYNFLIRNDELERAEKLKQFITLLSNINTYSPWYFKEISGLDTVLTRTYNHEEEFKINDAKSMITIKCLPDSMDDRIGTMLDLYKDVAYSHIWHREVLPANLRKFDMSIYIFSSPITTITGVGKMDGKLDSDAKNNLNKAFPVSYKKIELRDCEFDYNNINKTGYTGLNNTEGFSQEYEIPIFIGDAFETRYNTFIDREIGDIVKTDMIYNTCTEDGTLINKYVDQPQETSEELMNNIKDRLDYYNKSSIDLFGLFDDLTGNIITDTVKTQLLGNIYKASITDITEQLKKLSANLKKGNIGGVADNIFGLSEVRNGWYVYDLGNLHDRKTIYNR